MAIWSYITSAFNLAAPSFINAGSILTKVYFPREIVPIAAVGVASVDLAVVSMILLGLQASVGDGLHVSVVLLPLVYVALVSFVTGSGMVLATITVFLRDVRQVLPLLMQVLFIVTPIMYPASRLPKEVRWVLGTANPIAILAEAVRAVVIEGNTPDLATLAWPFGLGLAMTIGALRYIKSVELRFPDFL